METLEGGDLASQDYYSILNISKTSDPKLIKSAYRQMALKYHPDHNPNNKEALKKFNLAREAYEVLSDLEKKKQYDATYTPSEEVVEHASSTKGSTKARSPRKNLRYNLYITLEDVNKGCQRSIRYIRKNDKENETVQLKVTVPKGAFNHQRLRLAGYGDKTDNSFGDLVVILHLQNHPIFLKEGLNLRVNVPVSYLDVALGQTLEVPTLSGSRKVKLKPCGFDQLTFQFPGMGLPDAKLSHKGELSIHCFISNPESLNTAEKNALQKLVKTWPKSEMVRQYETYLKDRMRS